MAKLAALSIGARLAGYFAMPRPASTRHRKAMAMLMMREALAARWSADLTSRATQRPLAASVTAMPHVNTTPKMAAKAQPARLAPVIEKTSAWLMVSNESANAAPTAAITAGWLARASRSGSQWLRMPESATDCPGVARSAVTRLASPSTISTPMEIQAPVYSSHSGGCQ